MHFYVKLFAQKSGRVIFLTNIKSVLMMINYNGHVVNDMDFSKTLLHHPGGVSHPGHRYLGQEC